MHAEARQRTGIDVLNATLYGRLVNGDVSNDTIDVPSDVTFATSRAPDPEPHRYAIRTVGQRTGADNTDDTRDTRR